MGGSWGVYPRGGKWHRGAHRAWLVIKTDEHDVVQFDGPVLELLTEGRTRFDRRLAALGPDVLAPEFDATQFLSRLRAQEPGRQIGDALLDQRVVSGIGTVWKSEGCFLAGISPWRRVQDVSDDEVLTVIREIRPLMALSVEGNGRRRRWVFERAGLPCRRCATPIRFRGQGDDNRNTFWCPECQR
jgi:endonuclease-8